MRYEINEWPISIAYGFDELLPSGMFLSVCDERLEWDEYGSGEVNAIAELCGGGYFFQAHTGQNGLGRKVSVATMATFLRRYGVPEAHIDACTHSALQNAKQEANNNDDDGTQRRQQCLLCDKATTKTCAGCRCLHYCSRECQASDWRVHKFFCKRLPFPPRINCVRCVRGLLLQEASDKPLLVQVPLKRVRDGADGNFFDVPETEMFFKHSGHLYMRVNPLRGSSKFIHERKYNK